MAHLVEDQDCAVRIRESPHRLEEPVGCTAIAGGFHHDGGKLVEMCCEKVLQ